MPLTVRRFYAIIVAGLILGLLALVGCSSTASTSLTGGASSGSGTATAARPTATAVVPCTQFVPAATPFSSVSGVPGLQLPAGSYIGPSTTGGGGTGQYSVTGYTLCFQGSESAIDGGTLLPSSTPTSSIGYLVHSGWTLNNIFPDPTNFAYLDYCSNDSICLNDKGSPHPFTFVKFGQYASQSGGYTTFHLEVAAIAAPTCLNDPTYYSGTPKYAIYYDSNSSGNSSNNHDHFLLPPGTRVSTYQGGGTAGSTYVYFCSAGTKTTVVDFLEQAMQNGGWAISAISASGFTATIGTSPNSYTIDVDVQNPNNYYLRVFVPM
jgi:hypothetical protein